MSYRELMIAVEKYQGWMEGDTACFPSVYLKRQFEKYCEIYRTR